MLANNEVSIEEKILAGIVLKDFYKFFFNSKKLNVIKQKVAQLKDSEGFWIKAIKKFFTVNPILLPKQTYQQYFEQCLKNVKSINFDYQVLENLNELCYSIVNAQRRIFFYMVRLLAQIQSLCLV